MKKKKPAPARRDAASFDEQALAAADTTQPPMPHRRKQALTTPLISVAHTPHIFIKVLGPVVEKEMPNFARNETGTVPLMEVADLDSGEVGQLIVPAVLMSALERIGDYVGHSFEVLAKEPRPGKSYRDISVWELD